MTSALGTRRSQSKWRWRPPLLVHFCISILLAIIPVSIVVAFFLQALDHHMNKTQLVFKQTTQATSELAKLTDDFKSLERAIRQNWLLKDAPLEQTIENKWQQVQTTIDSLVANSVFDTQTQVWEALSNEFKQAHQVLFPNKPQEADVFAPLYQKLKNANNWLSQWKNQVIQEREVALASLQQTFIKWLIAIIPLSLLIAGIFLLSISKQLGRLSKTIDKLGRGQWQSPIKVTGSSELVELGAQLEWMRNQLQSLEQQKDTFLRHVTHELKTPLASIIESTSLLKDDVVGPTNPQQQDLLDLLDQSNERLCGLIDNLLNYNAFRARKNDFQSHDLTILQSKIQQHFELRLKANKQRLEWHQTGKLDDIYLDIEQLEIILIQLVSNAIKFSPPNEAIQVSLQQSPKELLIAVKDNGTGIPAEEKALVFDAFFQGTSGKNNTQKGNGLGLAIVNECVLQLNGKIEIDSDLKVGCNILIRFPLSSRENH